jgi:predicted nucleic acid-binding protein
MNVLVDTNVILDVLLKRVPFYADSYAIVELADQEIIHGWVSGSAITDIFYLANKTYRDIPRLYSLLDDLTGIFSIAPIFEGTIAEALALRWKDFEDGVQYMAAQGIGAEYIITRNKANFETSAILCMSPTEFRKIVDMDRGKSI